MRRGLRRGFTLVELMIVVAVIGILAALAIYGLRKYQLSAGTSEATSMLMNIRGAEEAWRSENLAYGGCKVGTPAPSTQTVLAGADLYPRPLGSITKAKVGYGPGQANAEVASCFQALAIRSDGPVRFSFGVMAGPPGTNGGGAGSVPAGAGVGFNKAIPTISAPVEPWYIGVAYGDRDDDARYSRLSTMSLQSEVYVDEDVE